MKKYPLADKNKIFVFATTWEQMYKNHASIPFYMFEDIRFVGNGMQELGFEMDTGNSLTEKYPNSRAFEEIEELERVLATIDIQTLGNAIFSQWRYWNHWSMGSMEEKDFQWFVIAFHQLAELAQ